MTCTFEHFLVCLWVGFRLLVARSHKEFAELLPFSLDAFCDVHLKTVVGRGKGLSWIILAKAFPCSNITASVLCHHVPALFLQ